MSRGLSRKLCWGATKRQRGTEEVGGASKQVGGAAHHCIEEAVALFISFFWAGPVNNGSAGLGRLG